MNLSFLWLQSDMCLRAALGGIFFPGVWVAKSLWDGMGVLLGVGYGICVDARYPLSYIYDGLVSW